MRNKHFFGLEGASDYFSIQKLVDFHAILYAYQYDYPKLTSNVNPFASLQ